MGAWALRQRFKLGTVCRAGCAKNSHRSLAPAADARDTHASLALAMIAPLGKDSRHSIGLAPSGKSNDATYGLQRIDFDVFSQPRNPSRAVDA